MKTKIIFAFALCGALAFTATAAENPAQTSSDNSAAPATAGKAAAPANSAPTARSPALSTGLDDVVKLAKAGVDESVILAFVRNSGTAYTPTAQDVIQLREAGVSAQVTTTLMQHGAEVRQLAAESYQRTQPAAPAAPAPAATSQPVIVYSAAPSYVAPVSTVTVIGYPRNDYYSYPVSYSYGGYYNSGYSYPRYNYSSCYIAPRFSVGVNFGGGFRGGFHSGFGHRR
ncbi:MAG: hypothetical protein EXS35_03760 [Pedosphaera sp.]|nr:hypothetical protein [Pedosphaera sp.]